MRSQVRARGRLGLVVAGLGFVAGLAHAQDAPPTPQPAPPPAPPPDAPAADQPPVAEPPRTDLEAAVETVAADEAGRPFPMPGEIVVSAARGVPLTYAGGRDVIERSDLETYPDASVATVIRRVPGVYVLPEQGNDGKVNIGIRGASPRRSGFTTLLVDGVPTAEAPYGSTDVDMLPVSLERVARVDVIRSGASIRYGSNPAAGVVNFVTEPIPESPTFITRDRYGSDDDYAVSTLAGGTWGRFGALASVVRRGGDGYRENSEYTIDDGSLRVKYAFSACDVLTASVSRYVELDAEMPGGLTPEAYEDDPSQSQRHGQDYRGDINTYTAEFVHEFSPTSSFQVLGWYHDGLRELYGFRPNPPPFTQRTAQHSEFEAGAIEARLAWDVDILGVRNAFFHSARYLVEQNYLYYYRTPLPSGPTVMPVVLDADFETKAMAFYNEDVIGITDTVALTLGARVEVLTMGSEARNSDIERESDYDEFLPVVSLTWEFLPRAALYGTWLEGFYTPQYETGFDPSSEIYNAVDPEHSETLEFGVRMREIDGLSFTAAWFDTLYTDKIEFVNQPNGTKLTYNVGEQENQGYELGAELEFGRFASALDGLSLYGTYTRLRARVTEGQYAGNVAIEAPEELASWGVEYRFGPGLWVRVGGSYAAESFHEPENYTETDASGQQGIIPSVSLWDAAVGWNQNPDGTGFGVKVGVTNLLDADYFRRFGGGIEPGAPRQYFVAGSYTVNW